MDSFEVRNVHGHLDSIEVSMVTRCYDFFVNERLALNCGDPSCDTDVYTTVDLAISIIYSIQSADSYSLGNLTLLN
jgi:hypothetical protein